MKILALSCPIFRARFESVKLLACLETPDQRPSLLSTNGKSRTTVRSGAETVSWEVRLSETEAHEVADPDGQSLRIQWRRNKPEVH